MANEGEMPSWAIYIMENLNTMEIRMKRKDGRMERMEGSFSRRINTLEVRLDSKKVSPKIYHASSCGYAPNTYITITPDTLHQMFNPLGQVNEPINQAPTYLNNQNQIHQEAP